MNRWILNAIGLSAVGALLCCGWACYQVGSAVHENRANLAIAAAGAKAALNPNGAGVPTLFNEARDITIAILKPCKPGKPETCGLIPAVRSVAENAGGAVEAMRNQVNQTQPLIQNAAQAIASTSDHANKAIDAATETTQQARVDLLTMNDSIAASKPLLEAYTAAGGQLNELLKRKAIEQILDHAAGILDHGDSISGNFDRVSTKLTNDFLAPKPWYRKALPTVNESWDIISAGARLVP